MCNRNFVGGRKAQGINNTKEERDLSMKGIKKIEERKAQLLGKENNGGFCMNENEKDEFISVLGEVGIHIPEPKFLLGDTAQNVQEYCIKEHESERFYFHLEAIKGIVLGHITDINTIPVIKVKMNDLCGIREYPWNDFWDKKENINLDTPVVLDCERSVIAGMHQYLNAVKNGSTDISAVYMESLGGKFLSANNLKNQFGDSIYTSFAYNLYALLSEHQNRVSYSKFCNKFDELWYEDEIFYSIQQYIRNNNSVMGG